MTTAYRADMAKLFVFAANTLAMVVPMGVAAWRSPRGGSLRVFAPLAIGFLISFVFMFFSFIPAPLAAAALLQGLVLGLGLLAVVRMRKVPVPPEASATSDWAKVNYKEVNGRAIRRVLPWVVLGLAACALAFGRDNWLERTQAFATSIFVASIGVLSAGARQRFAQQRSLFAAMVFFLLFLFVRGADGIPDLRALQEALPYLAPAIIAAYVLYQAASKPMAILKASVEKEPKP